MKVILSGEVFKSLSLKKLDCDLIQPNLRKTCHNLTGLMGGKININLMSMILKFHKI